MHTKVGFLAVALLLAPQSIIVSYPPGGAGGGYNTIEDEATPLTQRTTLNFTGAGVSCADASTKTTCTISGGGSTSPGGASGDVQYNDGAGGFGGEAAFNYTAASNLLVAPTVRVSEEFSITGDTSPAQLTADQNDYAGCGTTSSVCRLSVDTTARDITGITGGIDGRVLTLVNITNPGYIYLIDEFYNTSSTAANRLNLGGFNCILSANDTATLLYDSTSSRWRIIGGTASCGWNHYLGKRHIIDYQPCYSAATGTDTNLFDQTASGTGAAMNVPLAVVGGACYMTLTLGTTTTGRASATTSLTGGYYFSGGYTTFVTAVITGAALSDGTDDYIYYVGSLDSVSAEPTDGCFLKYNDGVNSGRWQGVCTNNSTPSTCDTGVTVATSTAYSLGIRVNKAGTSVTFFVNRTNTCTVTTNIPVTSARAFAWGYAIRKTLGTTSRSWYQGPFEVRTDTSIPGSIF